MLWKKIYKIFKSLLNVFKIGDDILPVGYNSAGTDYERMLKGVLKCVDKETLNLTK